MLFLFFPWGSMYEMSGCVMGLYMNHRITYVYIYILSADLMVYHVPIPSVSIFKIHKTHQWPQNHVICKFCCLAVLLYVQALPSGND